MSWRSGLGPRAAEGIATSYSHAEDWGWFIEYSGESDAELAIHCHNVEGSKDQWLLSVRRFGRKLFGRDKPPMVLAAPLLAGIRMVLEKDPSIADLEWLLRDDSAGP